MGRTFIFHIIRDLNEFFLIILDLNERRNASNIIRVVCRSGARWHQAVAG